MTEVRPLRLHDLPFIYRVSGRAVNFDVQLGLTVGEDALRHALMASLGRMQAYVVRGDSSSIVGQLHYLPTQYHARLAYVAPSLADGGDPDLWVKLLEGLVVVAGHRGVITLIAEVGVSAPEFAVLRRAGFATYARQDVWVRRPGPVEAPCESLRPTRTGSENGMLSLYGQLVPGLIKHVEPPPESADMHYVLPERRGSAGIVLAYEGPNADLIEVYVAPHAEAPPRDILNAALAAAQADKRTVYCRVRDYMGCPGSALAGVGFEHVVTQAAMYRHTAARVKRRRYDVNEIVEGGIPLPTSIIDRPAADATHLWQIGR